MQPGYMQYNTIPCNTNTMCYPDEVYLSLENHCLQAMNNSNVVIIIITVIITVIITKAKFMNIKTNFEFTSKHPRKYV